MATPATPPSSAGAPDGRAPDAIPLLEARELYRSVDGRELWGGLGMRVDPGDRIAVQGPSGSGKTLLLRSLAGLEPLERGAVALLGRDQASWAMPAYRSQLMLLAQRPSLPEGTVAAALTAPFAFRAHARRSFDAAVAHRYLAEVGRSPGFLEKDTTRLSGGEQQLAALLRALVLEPRVLLLDEPTASLDTEASEAVEALVAAWLRSGPERAYLWTSHDPGQRARVGDRSLSLGPAA